VLFVATVWFTDNPIPTVTMELSIGCPVEASITLPLILPSKKVKGCPNTRSEPNDKQTKKAIKATKNQKPLLIFFPLTKLLSLLKIKFILLVCEKKR
jgi:hypothetical protein